MNEFFTAEVLSTFTGMVAFVTATTQLVKHYTKVNPKWIALIATIVGQLSIQLIFEGDASMQGITLSLLNIISVLLGSIGIFETVVKPVQRKVQKSPAR